MLELCSVSLYLSHSLVLGTHGARIQLWVFLSYLIQSRYILSQAFLEICLQGDSKS